MCHGELGAAVVRDQQSQGAVEGGSAVAGPIAAMSATADIVTNVTSSFSKKKLGYNSNQFVVLTNSPKPKFTKHFSKTKEFLFEYRFLTIILRNTFSRNVYKQYCLTIYFVVICLHLLVSPYSYNKTKTINIRVFYCLLYFVDCGQGKNVGDLDYIIHQPCIS